MLLYPALQLSPAPGVSRSLHLFDPIVPVALLQALARAYVPRSYAEAAAEPLIHPLLADDATELPRFPPTFLLAGGLDPLLDDAVDLHTRLTRAGVPGALTVYRELPHGWLNFAALPGAAAAVGDLRRCVWQGLHGGGA